MRNVQLGQLFMIVFLVLSSEVLAMSDSNVEMPGDTPPEEIPFSVKMDAFLLHYFDNARPEISANDNLRLSKIAGQFSELKEAMARRAYDRMSELSCRFRIGSSDALVFLREMALIQQEIELEESEQYMALLDPLTIEGKEKVLIFLDTNVGPRISYSKPDVDELARRNPEKARQLVESICARFAQDSISPEDRKFYSRTITPFGDEGGSK